MFSDIDSSTLGPWKAVLAGLLYQGLTPQTLGGLGSLASPNRSLFEIVLGRSSCSRWLVPA